MRWPARLSLRAVDKPEIPPPTTMMSMLLVTLEIIL
jgi:hypothetical protein